MPRFDGTGPQGRGPMTGRGGGFCVLQEAEDDPRRMVGLAGLQSAPVGFKRDTSDKTKKEVSDMPRGDGTGPAGMGPMTGRAAGYCAGYPAPGYMNPAPVGYGAPYPGRPAPRFGGGMRSGGGFGRGRGGRGGRRW